MSSTRELDLVALQSTLLDHSHMDRLHPRQASPSHNEAPIGEEDASTCDEKSSRQLLGSHSAPMQLAKAQLPTPQSPGNLETYMPGPHTPESPLPHPLVYSATLSSILPPRSWVQYHSVSNAGASPLAHAQQILTPESSPVAERTLAPTRHDLNPRYPSNSVNAAPVSTSLFPARTFSLSTSSEPIDPAGLSSPLPPKMSVKKQQGTVMKTLPESQSTSPQVNPPLQLDDLFSSELITLSTPPPSPVHLPASSGVEMEGIHGSSFFMQEAESRRPEYFKRAKRSLLEVEPSAQRNGELGATEDPLAAVGIAISPRKGRRLKLFQETSEESFEESLMAGGYGLYRTVPQVAPGPSSIISVLEAEAHPTEKDLKMQRRLDAFRTSSTGTALCASKLCPVELHGKGRVLFDTMRDDDAGLVEQSSPKKRANRRRKKVATGISQIKHLPSTPLQEIKHQLPNWLDSEFPWCLRAEERSKLARSEEQERLKCIEKFLDGDSDDQDDHEPAHHRGSSDERQDITWMGRGKMVPLTYNPGMPSHRRRDRLATFPSDPADAKVALLSKKCARALLYRTRRRPTAGNGDAQRDDVGLCICRGRDDGQELVQCDECQTWYHLQCIGIDHITELGKEEDPWFCNLCPAYPRTPSPDQAPMIEPTFVPTDAGLALDSSYDVPFFQRPRHTQDSPVLQWNPPRLPTTPTRGTSAAAFSSGSSWNSSRRGPVTPSFSPHNAPVYIAASATDQFRFNQPPFDPTSTPSRGISFGAPFLTPKNTLWPTRASRLFHTPSLPGRSSVIGAPGGPVQFDACGGYVDSQPMEDSPIRRATSPAAASVKPWHESDLAE